MHFVPINAEVPSQASLPAPPQAQMDKSGNWGKRARTLICDPTLVIHVKYASYIVVGLN